MDRRRSEPLTLRSLVAVGALCLAHPGASAETPRRESRTAPAPALETAPAASGPTDRARGTPPAKPRAPRRGKNADRESFSQQFEKMTPEERARFKRNLQAWSSMTPEERGRLRSHGAYVQFLIRREIEETLRSSGLELAPEQRERFVRRYVQRRGEMERALHHEMERARRARIAELVEELKREFQTPPPSSRAPAPSTTEESPSP